MSDEKTSEAVGDPFAGHTPGPWRWFGNGEMKQVYLATTHSGRRYVMGFRRWGMSSAQPVFQPPGGIMVDASELVQFEVGDQSICGMDAARGDGSVYRYDIRGIDHSDARLIEASPTLLAENIELKRQLTILQVARSSDLTATNAGREIERDLQAKEVKALLDVCRRIVSEYESEGEVSIGCIEDARAALKSECPHC